MKRGLLLEQSGSLGERAAFWSLSQGMLCAVLRACFCAMGLGIPPGASLPLLNALCWLVSAECLCSILSVTTMSPLWLPSFQETELNSPPFECRMDSLAWSYEIECGRCDSVWLLRLGGKRHCDLPLALSLGKLILGKAGCHAMEAPKQHSEEVQGVKSSCQ